MQNSRFTILKDGSIDVFFCVAGFSDNDEYEVNLERSEIIEMASRLNITQEEIDDSKTLTTG